MFTPNRANRASSSSPLSSLSSASQNRNQSRSPNVGQPFTLSERQDDIVTGTSYHEGASSLSTPYDYSTQFSLSGHGNGHDASNSVSAAVADPHAQLTPSPVLVSEKKGGSRSPHSPVISSAPEGNRNSNTSSSGAEFGADGRRINTNSSLSSSAPTTTPTLDPSFSTRGNSSPLHASHGQGTHTATNTFQDFTSIHYPSFPTTDPFRMQSTGSPSTSSSRPAPAQDDAFMEMLNPGLMDVFGGPGGTFYHGIVGSSSDIAMQESSSATSTFAADNSSSTNTNPFGNGYNSLEEDDLFQIPPFLEPGPSDLANYQGAIESSWLASVGVMPGFEAGGGVQTFEFGRGASILLRTPPLAGTLTSPGGEGGVEFSQASSTSMRGATTGDDRDQDPAGLGPNNSATSSALQFPPPSITPSNTTTTTNNIITTSRNSNLGDRIRQLPPQRGFPARMSNYDAPSNNNPGHGLQPPSSFSQPPASNINAIRSLPDSNIVVTQPSPSLSLPLYSATGFDLLSILARVAIRPRPQIRLGPIDMSTSFTVVDVRKPDCPIIYCSPSFCTLTGFTEEEVVGRNCRFLQSPDGNTKKGEKRLYTNDEEVAKIRRASAVGKEVQANLINYKKGGTAFVNHVTIIPITGGRREGIAGNLGGGSVLGGGEDEIVYSIGFQVDLNAQPAEIMRRLERGTYKPKDAVEVTISMAEINALRVSVGLPSASSAARPGTADGRHGGGGHPTSMMGGTSGGGGGAMSSAARKGHSMSNDSISKPFRTLLLSDDAFLLSFPPPTAVSPTPPSTSTSTLTQQEIATRDRDCNASHSISSVLLSALPDTILVLTLKGGFSFVSRVVEGMLGWSPEELVGRSVGDLCHPSDLVPLLRELKDSATTTNHPASSSSSGNNSNDDTTPDSAPSDPAQPRTVDLLFRARTKAGVYVWMECRGRLYVEPGKSRKAIVLSARVRGMVGMPKGFILPRGSTSPEEKKKTDDVWATLSWAGTILSIGSADAVRTVLGYDVLATGTSLSGGGAGAAGGRISDSPASDGDELASGNGSGSGNGNGGGTGNPTGLIGRRLDELMRGEEDRVRVRDVLARIGGVSGYQSTAGANTIARASFSCRMTHADGTSVEVAGTMYRPAVELSEGPSHPVSPLLLHLYPSPPSPSSSSPYHTATATETQPYLVPSGGAPLTELSTTLTTLPSSGFDSHGVHSSVTHAEAGPEVEDDVWRELAAGGATSWQFEIQQMRMKNRGLEEEIRGLEEMLGEGGALGEYTSEERDQFAGYGGSERQTGEPQSSTSGSRQTNVGEDAYFAGLSAEAYRRTLYGGGGNGNPPPPPPPLMHSHGGQQPSSGGSAFLDNGYQQQQYTADARHSQQHSGYSTGTYQQQQSNQGHGQGHEGWMGQSQGQAHGGQAHGGKGQAQAHGGQQRRHPQLFAHQPTGQGQHRHAHAQQDGNGYGYDSHRGDGRR